MNRARKTTLMMAAAAAAMLIAAPAFAETVAIVNAHIFTCGAQGEIANGTVVIKDGKIIVSVGAGARARGAAGVIDAHGGVG